MGGLLDGSTIRNTARRRRSESTSSSRTLAQYITTRWRSAASSALACLLAFSLSLLLLLLFLLLWVCLFRQNNKKEGGKTHTHTKGSSRGLDSVARLSLRHRGNECLMTVVWIVTCTGLVRSLVRSSQKSPIGHAENKGGEKRRRRTWTYTCTSLIFLDRSGR